MEKHPLHSKIPELQNSPEVEKSVKRKERVTGKKVPNNPPERIEAYLERLERLVLDPENTQKKKDMGDVEHIERPRALSLLREKVLNEYVRPNKAQMAQGAARVEQRAARQMGIHAEYDRQQLEQRGEVAVGDLESSLDQWITYLSDPNEPYPVWFRYYAFRNILNLGEYDKDKQEFPKRSKGTFKLFPDVDRGALAYIEEIMTAAQDEEVLQRIQTSQKELGTPDADLWTKQKAQAFTSMSFAKQYAEGIRSQGEITPELRAETRGEWVHYRQGDNPKELWKSLQNKGTAWCTRGYPTAANQLNGGDFHVYYTLDAMGKPTIPRIAIRMEGEDKIAEPPRGVFDSQQNLEPNMVNVLDQKLKEFGKEADEYKKKSADMKLLTSIEQKTATGERLTRDELVFLYETNQKIEGFGYGEDPRVKELRSQRNRDRDMEVIFECEQKQIARSSQEVNKLTRAYVGPLSPGIFKIAGHLEHIYTSFPAGRVARYSVEIGGQTEKQLEAALERGGIKISENARYMMQQKEFKTANDPEQADLVCVAVGDLFNDILRPHTTDEIYQKADQLGLELCPAEVVPHLCLKHTNQDLGGRYRIAMKQISDPEGHPSIFFLDQDDDGMLLDYFWARPGIEWDPRYKFIFRVRK